MNSRIGFLSILYYSIYRVTKISKNEEKNIVRVNDFEVSLLAAEERVLLLTEVEVVFISIVARSLSSLSFITKSSNDLLSSLALVCSVIVSAMAWRAKFCVLTLDSVPSGA